MSKKGITGHDDWVVTQALATALVALEQLPEKIQPLPHMEDLRKLLTAGSACVCVCVAEEFGMFSFFAE
jgi:hypothetical protein